MSNYQMNENTLILVGCEGNSEKYYMEILLEADKLVFSKTDLFEEEILEKTFNQKLGKYLESSVLSMDFGTRDVHLLLIQDNDVSLKIKALYKEKLNMIVKVITTPEIEMLAIHHFGLFQKYTNQKKSNWRKPSKFLADELGMKTSRIKSKQFIKATFDGDCLVTAIKAYASKNKQKYKGKDDIRLVDILK